MTNKEMALLEDMAEKGFTVELIGRNIIVKHYGEELTSSYFIDDDNKAIDLRKELLEVCKYYLNNNSFDADKITLNNVISLQDLIKEHIRV